MYTSYIGKKFLKLYNEKEGKNLSAEDFFVKIQFPIFFDDEKHLLHVHGSTFFQKVSKDDLSGAKKESIVRLERLQKDISQGKKSGSTYVGYAAEKITEVTSGQLSNINPEIDKQELYSSWIGEGLSLGVRGELILFDNEELLWQIFQGWKVYRKYLNQTPNLKARQIETWNGQFIYSTFLNSYESPYDFNPPIGGDEEESGVLSIPTIPWIKLIFALSKVFPKISFIGNAYVLSKINSSYGFVKVFLPEIRKIYELRDEIFLNQSDTILSDEEINSLSSFYNFKEACKLGTIGLKSIEPAKLREYMPKGSVLYAQGKEYKFSNEESYTNYKLFKIWIIAMLNKTELLNLASDVAKALSEFELPKPDDRGKKVLSTLSQEVRESSNLRLFIDKLTEVLNHAPANADVFKNVVEEVLKMPSDNFPLFVTLIRFEYAYLKSNK